MKNLKFISVMMGCLAALCVTFTSCDDDDDNTRSLTPQEQQTAFNAVKGSYNGKLIYGVWDAKTKKEKADSTNISWSINNDSIMTISKFPVATLANCISDSTVSKAIATQAPQDLNCYIGFFRVTPPTFLINPIGWTLNLNYGGKAHKLQVQFYANTYYSFGELNGNRLVMQIIAGRILEDGKTANWLRSTATYVLTAKK